MKKGPKNLSGIWWLPEEPETKYHGLLVLEDDREVELRLLFETPKLPYRPLTQGADVLHGAAEDGTVVTLGRCRSAGSGKSGNGLERVKLSVGFVCVGFLMPTLTGEHISEAYFEFRALANWTKYDGLQEKHLGTGFTLNYNDQNSALVEIRDNVSAQIRHWSGPTSHIDREKSIEVRRRVNIRLSFAKPVAIDAVFEWVRIFEDYFTVACHCYAGAQDVLLVGNFGHRQFGDKSIPADCILKFRSRFSTDGSPRLGGHSLLFSEADLEEGWAKSFRRWAELHPKLSTPLGLYATALYARDTLDQKFVAYSQALEALHRRFYQGAYLAPADFKDKYLEKLRASVPPEIPRELREAIKARLQYANEHSLKKRLEELSAPIISTLRGKVPNWDTKALRHIVEIRNHLTHYSVLDQSPQYSGVQLWIYCEALRLLFEGTILSQLGFKSAAIDSLLLSNDHYSWSFQAARHG